MKDCFRAFVHMANVEYAMTCAVHTNDYLMQGLRHLLKTTENSLDLVVISSSLSVQSDTFSDSI
ncbi:hypothetical protein Mapa_017186 [Marchantia paleacea]|nr:hypothetical protein Mapa_017186 [Marchantia paleacea]